MAYLSGLKERGNGLFRTCLYEGVTVWKGEFQGFLLYDECSALFISMTLIIPKEILWTLIWRL